MDCPYCLSHLTIRHGKRKIKRIVVQVCKCQTCGKFFSDRALKHKSHDARTILRAISAYNLGYTFEQTAGQMSKRFHVRIPESTLRSWVKEYSGVCRFMRLRKQALKLCDKPEEMVFAQSLNHNRQIYNFQLHRAKLLLQSGELPDNKFMLLKAYLEKIPTSGFPHHLFQPNKKQSDNEEPQATRSSQMRFGTFGFVKAEKRNTANRLAELGLMLAKTNKERHEAIQSFMLTNDSVTAACEVPVYLTNEDIGYFRSKGFALDFENKCQTPITGHIDVLQIRNGLIHVLDYKPEADRVDATSQLVIYALALASRTNLAVRDIKCAWFDDKNYFEFFPLHAVYRKANA